jgi:hypothetical protein
LKQAFKNSIGFDDELTEGLLEELEVDDVEIELEGFTEEDTFISGSSEGFVGARGELIVG